MIQPSLFTDTDRYRVPPGYINCRIWVKIIGDKVIFEAMDRVIWKQRLKV